MRAGGGGGGELPISELPFPPPPPPPPPPPGCVAPHRSRAPRAPWVCAGRPQAPARALRAAPPPRGPCVQVRALGPGNTGQLRYGERRAYGAHRQGHALGRGAAHLGHFLERPGALCAALRLEEGAAGAAPPHPAPPRPAPVLSSPGRRGTVTAGTKQCDSGAALLTGARKPELWFQTCLSGPGAPEKVS